MQYLEVMRNEEFAYKEGFRVTKEGRLIHINGRKYKTRIRCTREQFAFRRNGKTFYVGVARLQAFQKFGKKMYDFNFVNHINSDPLDSSYDNINLGKGSELITLDLKEMSKTERAYHLNYRVSKEGDLLLNEVNVSDKTYQNNCGYIMFSIPFKKNRTQSVFVHRLQAYQKFGKAIYQEDCVRHLNGNCKDNSFENIEIGSFKENSNDISVEVKAKQYLKSALSQIKYPVKLRNKVRREFLRGLTVKELNKKYNIPERTIYSLVNGESII